MGKLLMRAFGKAFDKSSADHADAGAYADAGADAGAPKAFASLGAAGIAANERLSQGMLASVVCIVCNVALCAAKGAIGLFAGSVAIVADALNNLTDAASNVISLLGFKLAGKPADVEHPYGHGRYEYLAGLGVSVLVLLIGVELVRSSVEKIANPQLLDLNAVVVVVLILSISVKLWMALFNRRVGKRIGSGALLAAATDSRNDCISTAAVLASLCIGAATGIDLDGWAGMSVGLFILYSGAQLMRDTVSPLLGKAPDEETVNRIRNQIASYPGVLGTHGLMLHDYGPGKCFASAHVEMAAELDPLESHALIDDIEHDFREQGLPLVLHYDPIVTSGAKTRAMRG